MLQPPFNPFSLNVQGDLVQLQRDVATWVANREDVIAKISEPRQIEDDNGPFEIVLAVVKSATSLATNRWTYVCEPVEWDGTNKKYVTLTSTSVEYTAYNDWEAANTASVALLGYDLSVSGYTLAVQSIPVGTPVKLLFDVNNDVYTFAAPNELVVTCTAAADAMAIPTLFVPSNGVVTTTSATYAAVTAWDDPSVIDPNVFTWTKASGLAEAGQGDYRVRYSADVSSATNDSTIGLKLQYKIDAGSWTDVAGTTRVEAIATLAANATRVEAAGYVSVASGEELDLRLVVARTTGTGTPTIASGSLFVEFVQVST